VVEAYSQVARQFVPDEIALLEAFAVKASLALEKANLFRQKEEFLSMTAHDLRAPLTAIKMSTGLLADNLPENFPPLLLKLVDNISRNSQRLDDLMEDLLDLNRLEHGKVHLNLARCEAGELVKAVVTSLTPLFEEKLQHLTFIASEQECWIEVDRKRMDQILVNLLSNAHKYTPSNGTVTVALEAAGSSVVIKVSDNGPGIPLNEQSLIFDRYYRRPVHEQESKISGTGLGLPITRNLVELLEGKIWVESTPGVGTTFFVQLPQVTSEN
jgi:signal transduction histidine kinase